MNMIQNAKDQVLDLTVAAYGKAAAQGLLPEDVAVTPSVEIPKDTANGDYTTTFCLAAAKALKKNPRQVAQILMDHMDLAGSYFTSVEMAGPGFLNFRLGDKWFRDTVACVEREGADYGCNDTLKGQKIMVEFVSANPTGPMHMGNARGGVLGDTLASVLQKSGANVWREFYVNDAGNQIEKFAKSLEARYLQIIKGEDAVEFPEDGYHGDDIRELARAFYEKEGDKYLDCDEKTRHDALARFGLDNNIPKMQRVHRNGHHGVNVPLHGGGQGVLIHAQGEGAVLVEDQHKGHFHLGLHGDVHAGALIDALLELLGDVTGPFPGSHQIGVVVAAAGRQAQGHHQRQQQCKNAFHVFYSFIRLSSWSLRPCSVYTFFDSLSTDRAVFFVKQKKFQITH